MNISSILVSAAPGKAEQVQAQLTALEGVEVHAVSEEGQMIVTIETENDRGTVSTYETISKEPHVLAVSMVYHQIETDPDEEA